MSCRCPLNWRVSSKIRISRRNWHQIFYTNSSSCQAHRDSLTRFSMAANEFNYSIEQLGRYYSSGCLFIFKCSFSFNFSSSKFLWQCHEIFCIFFHESNPSGPLINSLKWFCWKICFREDLWQDEKDFTLITELFIGIIYSSVGSTKLNFLCFYKP